MIHLRLIWDRKIPNVYSSRYLQEHMSNLHCTFLTKSYSVYDLSLTEVDYQDFPFESCQLSNHKFPLAHFKK